MYCNQCGAELRADAQFCSKCGGTVAETPAVTPVPAAITSEATLLPGKKSAWKVWLLVGIITLLLGGGSVIGWQVLAKKDSTKTFTNTERKFPAGTEVGQEEKNPTDNAEMVWIPDGTFTMGSAAGVGEADEHPAHQVKLSGYWIYKYDVTVAQYRAFSATTGHKLPEWPGEYDSWKGKTGWDDPALQQHPIVNVTWYDAKAYADWAGVTLPTEAQWEYAARGPQGRNYPWGGTAIKGDNTNGWDATKCANYENTAQVNKSTWQVGSFPAGASWCGAQDMAGYAWQWCGDWFGDYAAIAVTNPTGPATGDRRVQRGGSWMCDKDVIRSSVRYSDIPDYFYNSYGYCVGFRCASLSPGP